MIRYVLALLALLAATPQEARAQATAAGITPCGAGITISASGTTANALLSTCGTSAIVWNVGSTEVFLNWGTASNTAATTSGWSLPAGSVVVLSTGRAPLYLAAITASGTSTLRVVQGQGMAAVATSATAAGATAVTCAACATAANQTATMTPVAPATATATNGQLLGGQYDSTQKTLTNGQQAAYSMSPRGALYVAAGAEAFNVTLNGGTILTPITPATATATQGALIGMQYNSTQATFTNGQQGSVQGSARGALYVATGADAFTVTGAGGTFPVTQSTSPWVTRLNTTPTVANGSGIVIAPSSEAGAGAAPVSSSALAANTVVKAGAGNLYAFEVSADATLSAAAWWVMIYNATTAPGDGAVTPAKCYAMPPGVTSFGASWGSSPAYFGTGITIGVSTTGCFTKTASTHAFISGDAQ